MVSNNFEFKGNVSELINNLMLFEPFISNRSNFKFAIITLGNENNFEQ